MQPEDDPDPEWVARLSGRSVGSARRALTEAAGETRLFRHIAREHGREGRRSYVEIDAPLELHALVRLTRPRHVVEVGVSSGVSSAYVLAALRKNRRGTLHSIDLPSFERPRRGRARPPLHSWSLPSGRSTGWAVPPGLRRGWDLRLGDKRELLPVLSDELPRIDLVVYDVPHEDAATYREFAAVDRRLPPNGIAIADHGPGGGLCGALRRWARRRDSTAVGRTGLGLYGFRAGKRPKVPRSGPA
ncbi:MAG TPA: class I SAM-dependent methyltransferase [Thermoplasmata archaeon]|nr:class I SAM-dependent methyltransferase [Thermoplasmata archaeon]